MPRCPFTDPPMRPSRSERSSGQGVAQRLPSAAISKSEGALSRFGGTVRYQGGDAAPVAHRSGAAPFGTEVRHPTKRRTEVAVRGIQYPKMWASVAATVFTVAALTAFVAGQAHG
jgi:hypothetical protein